MRPYPRAERVGAQLQRTLAQILLREIKDPRLKTASITSVKMSRDLRHARVYFVMTGPGPSQEEVAAGFEQARGLLKRFLARDLGLRYMPEIQFFYDDSFDYGAKIEGLLQTIKTQNG